MKKVTNNRHLIVNALNRDIPQVAEAANVITNLLSSTILVFGCLIYLLVLSVKLAVFTFIMIAIGILIYKYSTRKLGLSFVEARKLNEEFLKHINHILYGFKEILNDKNKSEDINKNFVKITSEKYFTVITKSVVKFINSQYLGEVLFYITVVMIITLGMSINLEKQNLIIFVFVLLFINGPIQGIVLALPNIINANQAARRLVDLKQELLTQFAKKNEVLGKEFHALEFRDVSYKYDDTGFEIGPTSLKLKKGDVVFICGSNGSGKTTFLMCFLGLYRFSGGSVLLNGVSTDAGSLSSLCSVVYSDFYLFDKFYGNRQFDKVKAQYYLKVFELNEKVAITENGFSNIDLSIGQRKRLAIIQALLENKPIIILDEWAADQDANFRRKFYDKIIPLIRDEGRTIVAITHDDAYYYVATKLIVAEAGKLIMIDPLKNA